jgi:hypothetical protein
MYRNSNHIGIPDNAPNQLEEHNDINLDSMGFEPRCEALEPEAYLKYESAFEIP